LNQEWEFWIDREGTFTDIIASDAQGNLQIEKLLSEAPSEYQGAAIEPSFRSRKFNLIFYCGMKDSKQKKLIFPSHIQELTKPHELSRYLSQLLEYYGDDFLVTNDIELLTKEGKSCSKLQRMMLNIPQNQSNLRPLEDIINAITENDNQVNISYITWGESETKTLPVKEFMKHYRGAITVKPPSNILSNVVTEHQAHHEPNEERDNFQSKIKESQLLTKKIIIASQHKMSREAVTNTLSNKNMGNDSWQNYLKICLDFQNIEPETAFIKKLPLGEQIKKAQMVAGFDNFDEPIAMKSAVACVLKAMCTSAKSDASFAHTSAMQQFVERFNLGEITGEVKNILYEIVDQEPGEKLQIDDFTKKQKEITQLTEAAMEYGFDLQRVTWSSK